MFKQICSLILAVALSISGCLATSKDLTLGIEDTIVIGDSNTVRMYLWDTSIKDAQDVFAVVGVGVSNLKFSDGRTNYSTIGKNSIEESLNTLKVDDLKQVVIMLGTNDFGSKVDMFKSNYQNLLDSLVEINPDVKIYLCTILPANSRTVKSSHVSKINQAIEELADENELDLIDVYSEMSLQDISKDGIHLTKSGCKKCAEFIVNSL